MRIGSGLPTRYPTPTSTASVLPTRGTPLTNNFAYDGPLDTLPVFHSLDLGARYRWSGARGDYRLAFGIQNAYLQSNPLFVSLQSAPETEEGVFSGRLTYVLLLPTLPFARLTTTFKHASRRTPNRSLGPDRRDRL